MLVVGVQELAPLVSNCVGQKVSSLQLSLIVIAVIYTIYKYEISDRLNSGIGAIISGFMAAGLIPFVKTIGVVSEGVFTYVGFVALVSLVTSDIARGRKKT
jgi:hypothetical protein